jgi:hypothetical protein
VIVPLGVAVIGASAALIVGWRGAKWAAKVQREEALAIDATRRRAQTQADALRDFDEVLDRLVQRADGYAKGWSIEPNRWSSSWEADLSADLGRLEVEWQTAEPKVQDESVRAAVANFLGLQLADRVRKARERHDEQEDQDSIDAARRNNQIVLDEAKKLRGIVLAA